MRKDLRIKICSFFTAAVVSLCTFFSSAGSIIVFASVAGAIGTILNVADFISTVAGLVDDGYLTLNEPAEEYYAFWTDVVISGGLTESQFEEYWTFVGTYGNDSDKCAEYPGLSSAYSAYVGSMRSSFSLSIFASRTFLDDGTCRYKKSADAGLVSIDKVKKKYNVTGEFIKDYYKEYVSRYMPMPNDEQYTVSWQNSNSEKYGTENKYFREAAPVYTNTRAWGNKGWTECYAMSFFVDPEQPGSPYFSNQYVHFYSTKDENNNVIIHYDTYNLDDNQLRNANSQVWNISKYPVLGYRLGGNDYWLFVYSSYQNCFVGNGTGICSVVSGSLTSFVNRSSQSLNALTSYSWSTYHPTTQKTDDYGYILSNKPFELFLNQTSIDFDKIPDNYYITIAGDNIYNYPITDPTNGKTTTINNYITNNYIIKGDDDSGSGGGDTTNNVWNIDFPDFITNITTSIETAITNVFVADIDVINNYNQEMQDTLNKKLPFLNDFGDIFKGLFVDIVDNNFVYAGDIKPKYNDSSGGGTAEESGTSESGGTVREEATLLYPKWKVDINFFGKDMELTILDFSLYAEPLYYVRIVVCVFIYVLYFVNLMRYLPTLIGNVMDMSASVSAVVNPPKKGGDKK